MTPPLVTWKAFAHLMLESELKGSIGAESVDLSLYPTLTTTIVKGSYTTTTNYGHAGPSGRKMWHFTPGFMYESRHAFGVVRNVDGTSLSRHSDYAR